MLTALLSATIAFAPVQWYGPATATFEVQFPGNPYDPAVNDVRVLFIPDKGTAIERYAYYDGVLGAYRATLVSKQPGEYRALLVRNGKKSNVPPVEKTLSLKEPMKRGFIRRDPVNVNRFRWDDNETYFPMGINLGWQGGGIIPMTEQIKKMSEAGMNWSRIWACHWDGKNPWWPQDQEGTAGQLWTPALERWHQLIEASEEHNVPFQMVLFHHGAFSSAVNPNWQDHPWNAKKGGFLSNAADFFTNAEAKRRTKMWLRYAVSRWAHSSSIMAWELFNEVEWVDARYQNRWKDIAAWHKEMADYIRELDPYNHLITTSSTREETEYWEAMDYLQPHTYPVDVATAIASEPVPNDKPLFFGEFGPGGSGGARAAIRDGILASLCSNHAGAAQYWFWDIVEKENLYDEFAKARKVIDLSGIAGRPGAKSLVLTVASGQNADLVVSPALGWTASTKVDYDIQPGVRPNLSGMSSYLQGTAHPEMQPGPFQLRFDAAKPGKVTVRLASVAKAGAHVKLWVGDKMVAEKSFAASEAGTAGRGDTLEAAFPAGKNVIKLENVGPDWAQVSNFTLTGIGPAADAMGVGDSTMSIVWLKAGRGLSVPTVSVRGLTVPDGEFEATVVRMDTGEESKARLKIAGSAFQDYQMPAENVVLIFR